MERPAWTTPDGRILYAAEIDKHHILWERKSYRTRLERLTRSMGGAVLLISRNAHTELHAQLPPPPKPNYYLMADIYHHARSQSYETQYDVFGQIAEYVGWVAANNRNPQHQEDAALLHAHLLDQAVFIEQGRLTPYERMVA